MDGLPLLYQQSPSLQQINLEFSEIESLDPLLPLLSKFTELKVLQLFGNRLETLPSSLSELCSLESLDISNNLIENIESIIPSLSTLPCLTDLHITLQTENDEEILASALPKLVTLNGTVLKRESKPQDIERSIVKSSLSSDTSFYENDSKRDFSPVYQESPLRAEESYERLEKTRDYKKDSVLGEEFVEKVEKIYKDIRMMWLKEDKSKDKRLEEDWDSGLRSISRDFEEYKSLTSNEKKVNLELIKAKYGLSNICSKKIFDLIFMKHNIIGGFLCRISEVQESLMNDVFSLTEKSIPEPTTLAVPSKPITEITPRSGRGSTDAEARFKKEKETMIKRFQEDRHELQEEIYALREENKKYLDTIIRHSKTFADAVYTNKAAEESKVYRESPNLWKASGKVLSLRQIKEVIDEIYLSKTKFDERCAENHMPRETMEQHMNNYLNKKYGLKNLVIEWGSSIIASVKKYSGKDNDISVFARILQNECDEEFRLVQIQVKETVAELLKMNIKNKFPLKNSNDIQEIVLEKMNGILIEEEWDEIVRYMYNEEDASVIIDDVWKIIKKNERNNSSPPPKPRVTREEAVILREKEKILKSKILFNDFLKVLLDFQLRGHEKFLERFLQLFRTVDIDSDGIVNEQEFRDLVTSMDLGFAEEDIDRLLQIIDPYDNQQITFSESVALFSTELIPIENLSVLKKLSMQ